MNPYSGQICADLLSSLQACYSGVSSPSPPLNIPSTTDQLKGESDAMLFLSGLPLLNPSQECLEKIQPFLCLHIFGLCDTNGNLRTTTRGECVRLRDDVCAAEWAIVLSFGLPPGTLPVCEDLPDADNECTGMLNDHETCCKITIHR